MKAIRTFFQTIRDSVTDVSSYAAFSKRKTFSAILHAYGKLFVLILLLALFLYVKYLLFIPDFQRVVNNLVQDASSIYPAELMVTITDGKAGVNVPEPYVIDLPAAWIGGTTEEIREDLPQHLLTIDTQGNADAFAQYQSLALLTAHALVIKDKDYGVRVIPLQQVNDMKVDKALVDGIVQKVQPYARSIPGILAAVLLVLVFLAPLFGALSTLLWYLFYLLILTAIVLLIAKLAGKERTYGALYRMGLHGLTIPLIYTAFKFVYPPIAIPWLWTVIFLVWMTSVLIRLPSGKRT